MADMKDIKDKSADEIQHIEEEQKRFEDTVAQGTKCITDAIDLVLTALGVDTNLDDEAHVEQMGELGIIVKSYVNQPNVAPQIQGFYIFQLKPFPPTALTDLYPIAFVGDVKVNSIGEMGCEIYWFDKDTLTIVTGPQLPH